jgi:hypothetical protein
MASNLDEVRSALIRHLVADPVLAASLEGRVFADPSTDLPSAWIGITQDRSDEEWEEFLITVHVRLRSGNEQARQLIEQVAAALKEPPAVNGAAISDWSQVHSEVRPVQDNDGLRGLVRYRARLKPE